jgi:ribose transport system permease protein
MLPFAAVLAIAAIGQTLVIQQGGIDLSVPGVISLSVVLVTHIPNGDNGKLVGAILIAFGVALAAGLITGLLVTWIGITPIVATLGMNALLLGAIVDISGGTPRSTSSDLRSFASGEVLGIDTTVIVALVVTAVVAVFVKRTTFGRRFEAVGANAAAARAAGFDPRGFRLGAYVSAALLYCCAGVLLAGILGSPGAFQGNAYLLPSVAAVVLGGTSLLGGHGSVVATCIAALFLSQLDQFVLATGASAAVQNLVQAAALAAGIAIYSVSWRRLRLQRPLRPQVVQPLDKG